MRIGQRTASTFTLTAGAGAIAVAEEEENAFKHVLFEIDPGGTSYVIAGSAAGPAGTGSG